MIARKVALRLKEVVDGFGGGPVHARRLLQLLDARLADAGDRAEVAAQRLAPLRPDADDVVENGDEVALAAQLAVVGDGEAVRLVADALDEVERLAVARQDDRLALTLLEDELELLGEADDGHILVAARPADDLER